MAKIEEKRKLNNFRELIDYAEETYGDNICYKYKKDIKEKPATIVETTFKTVATKVRGLATFILNYEKEMKRIVVIGDNSEKWVEGYLGVATSGKIVAPMDKLLPEKEIESLLKRSDIDAAITDKNHLEIFKRLRDKKDNKLETIICMEKVDDKDIIDLETAIEEGLVTRGYIFQRTKSGLNTRFTARLEMLEIGRTMDFAGVRYKRVSKSLFVGEDIYMIHSRYRRKKMDTCEEGT